MGDSYYDLCSQVSNYKKSDSIHKFCNYAKWYCIYYKLKFNKINVTEAFKKYKGGLKNEN